MCAAIRGLIRARYPELTCPANGAPVNLSGKDLIPYIRICAVVVVFVAIFAVIPSQFFILLLLLLHCKKYWFGLREPHAAKRTFGVVR